MNEATFPTLLKPEQAARKLGIQPGTLANWRSSGGGPRFVRISGNRVFYAESDLAAFVDSRRRTSTADSGSKG